MRTIKFDRTKFHMDESGAWLMLRIPTAFRQSARAFVYEMTQDRLHVADIKKYREKRSLDANAYFWKLCGELAAVTGIPMNSIYQDYIRQIGDNFEILSIKNEAIDHWKMIWESRGIGWICDYLGPSKIEGYTNMACYYGSSTYNTAQMSRLIDFLIYDCKEQDIETATPEELAKMIKEWEE